MRRKNTPEEMVLAALEKGFCALGFSGHATVDFDTSYCLQNIDAYITAIRTLKEKYQKEIQIYIGIEEEAYQWVDRSKFDYLIGSSHYLKVNGVYHPLDCGADKLADSIEAFGGNALQLTEAYFSQLCTYIQERKPDIVGHFDLITKYEETKTHWFLDNPDYHALAEKYMKIAAQNDLIFEVNTGAIARGIRTSPYPYENLLHILQKEKRKIILNSDSHCKDTLDCHFKECRTYLKDIGFHALYVLYNGQFQKDLL